MKLEYLTYTFFAFLILLGIVVLRLGPKAPSVTVISKDWRSQELYCALWNEDKTLCKVWAYH